LQVPIEFGAGPHERAGAASPPGGYEAALKLCFAKGARGLEAAVRRRRLRREEGVQDAGASGYETRRRGVVGAGARRQGAVGLRQRVRDSEQSADPFAERRVVLDRLEREHEEHPHPVDVAAIA
jgi:hypothetical protein